MVRYLLSACDGSEVAVVARRLSLRQLLPPKVSPFGDTTTDGGWAGLTGNQVWVPSSILGLLFAPIFANAASMVSLRCPSTIESLPGVPPDLSARVCACCASRCVAYATHFLEEPVFGWPRASDT